MEIKKGAVAGIVAAFVVLLFLGWQGALAGAGFKEIIAVLSGVTVSLLVGAIIYTKFIDIGLGTATSTLGSFIIGMLVAVIVVSGVSPTLGQATGLRAKPAPPAPPAPEKEAFAMVSVSNALAEPTEAIGNAKVRILKSEPAPGISVPKYASDNTDSSGAATIKTEGVYPATPAWVSVVKPGFYPEYTDVTLAESLDVAEPVDFSGTEEPKGLHDLGTLSISVRNESPADNIAFDGENIKLDFGAGPFEFDILIETSESDSVLRNLRVEMDRGGDWDSISADLAQDVAEAEGVEASVVEGDITLATDDEATLDFVGDLAYLKDVRLRVSVSNASATGTLETMDINDLLDDEAIHGVTGIAKDSLTVKLV